jgi:GTP cyclohydrolase I
MVGKRLQLQERIGSDILEILIKVLGTEDVAVRISGRHSCMTARGIKKPSITTTCALSGAFKENSDLRQEFYSNIAHNK